MKAINIRFITFALILVGFNSMANIISYPSPNYFDILSIVLSVLVTHMVYHSYLYYSYVTYHEKSNPNFILCMVDLILVTILVDYHAKELKFSMVFGMVFAGSSIFTLLITSIILNYCQTPSRIEELPLPLPLPLPPATPISEQSGIEMIIVRNDSLKNHPQLLSIPAERFPMSL